MQKIGTLQLATPTDTTIVMTRTFQCAATAGLGSHDQA